MKRMLYLIAVLSASMLGLSAQVRIDPEVFGNSLGGWNKRGKNAAEYPLSGSTYRTFKPEVTPTPDGGIFVSVRIDHVRGIFSSDDYATLEVTINSKGGIESAQSNIAIQGRSIASDVILGTTKAGQVVGGVDRAVQIGTDLVANLSAKLLREKVVESGRVTFPAAVRHNYNLLYQAIRVGDPPTADATETKTPEAGTETAQPAPEEPKPENSATTPEPSHSDLEIQPFQTPTQVEPKTAN